MDERDIWDDWDDYQLLEVGRDATVDEVRVAWKFLTYIWHPDRHPGVSDATLSVLTRRSQAINAARDRILRGAPRCPQSSASSRPPSSSGASQASPPFDDAQLQDLLVYLGSIHAEVIDKSPAGGALWVVGTHEQWAEEMQEIARRFGRVFQYASKGGRATQHRPAWYL